MANKITITKKAAEEVLKLAKKEKKENYGLKIFVFPGGCSGVQYGLDFAKKAEKEDLTFEEHGVKLFVEKNTIEVLEGTKIDYVENKEGSGFKIENPNVSACDTCGSGCG